MKDLLELFLKQDINVNSKASIIPALHCAASTEIAQILLDHGANPYLRSNEHRTALECQLRNNEVAALLRQIMTRENIT
jgi:ankyrin repeat protein